MKTYKWFRGLLKASAFATVMFVMQACYGVPHDDMDDSFFDNEEMNYQAMDTIQNLSQEVLMEAEAE